MKLLEFRLTTKDNTTCYESVAKHLAGLGYSIITSAAEIIDKDFVAQLHIDYETDNGLGAIKIVSYDVQTLMQWVKENNPELYDLIPPFRIDQFEHIAHEMKSSSHLEYRVVDDESDRGYEFGPDPDTDDFVPERETVEESINAIKQAGHYCELHCYPNTPVGFWNFYGLDFQSLLDHVVED